MLQGEKVDWEIIEIMWDGKCLLSGKAPTFSWVSIDYVEVSDIQHCDLSSIIAYSFIHTAILIISSSFFGFLMRDFDSLTAFVRIYVIASEHGMDKSKCEMSKILKFLNPCKL